MLKVSSFKEVSDYFDIPIPTLKLWKKAAKAAGTMGDGPGLARPSPRKVRSDAGKRKKVTPRMLNAIRRKLKQTPGLTCNDLRASVPGLNQVTRRTLNNIILHDLKLPSRVAAKKPLLNPKQIARRLNWAAKHKNWSQSRWRKVLFSDEANIEIYLGGTSYHRRVRRGLGMNRYHPKFTRKTVKNPAKLMAWGCLGNGRLGELHILPANTRMNSKMYIEVLNKRLRSSMRKTGCSVFQQDNAPCHVSNLTKDWFERKRIEVLDWPGSSPDMNPIENLWRHWKAKLFEMTPAKNLAELEQNMKLSWKRLGRETRILQSLTDSAANRVAALWDVMGEPTKY